MSVSVHQQQTNSPESSLPVPYMDAIPTMMVKARNWHIELNESFLWQMESYQTNKI